MSDVDSGAVAPAEPSGVPIEAAEPSTQPLGSQTPVAEKPPEPEVKAEAKPEAKPEPKDEKPSKSAGEAVRKAFDKLNKDAEAKPEKPVEAKPAVDAKPATDAKPVDPKPEQLRENGKFASANPKPEQAEESPTWLKSHEKEHWQKAPPEVRAIVERRNTEAAAGLEKYRASHEAQERLKPFSEMAQQAGTTVEAALKSYTDLDKLLHTDKVRGIEAVLHRVGITPHEYASHILNQSPDEQRSQSDTTIRELKSELASLKEQVGGVTQTFQHQREQSTLQEVTKFADSNPRFEELHEQIVEEMRHGYSLQDAYSRAERLNPAAAPVVKPAPTAELAPEPQSLAGEKSIHGAPSTGSNPGQRKPSSSNRQALERAFARIG